jgi:hypothetical protein
MFATFAGMSKSPSFSTSRLIPFLPQDIFTGTYHFGIGTSGLAYLGIGVGFAIAFVFGSKFADQIYKHVSICFQAKLTGFLFLKLFFLLSLYSLPQRMAALIHQKCGSQHYLLDHCSFLLVFCKLFWFKSSILSSLTISGFSWYGWSAAAGIQWMMPIIGTAFFGFGKINPFMIQFLSNKLIWLNLPRPVDSLVRI